MTHRLRIQRLRRNSVECPACGAKAVVRCTRQVGDFVVRYCYCVATGCRYRVKVVQRDIRTDNLT